MGFDLLDRGNSSLSSFFFQFEGIRKRKGGRRGKFERFIWAKVNLVSAVLRVFQIIELWAFYRISIVSRRATTYWIIDRVWQLEEIKRAKDNASSPSPVVCDDLFLSFFFQTRWCSLLFKGVLCIGIWISFKKLQRGTEDAKTAWNVHTYRKVTGKLWQASFESAIPNTRLNSWRGLYMENLMIIHDPLSK